MKTKIRTQILVVALLSLTVVLSSCKKKNELTEQNDPTTASNINAIALAEQNLIEAQKHLPNFASPELEDKSVQVEGLPEKVQWKTAKAVPLGSLQAKSGGTFRSWIPEFPLTFRYVGPDSNASTRSLVLDNVKMSLIDMNQETQEFLPGLASHWAFSKDKQTVYFKLYPQAKWSDGEPLTADDFAFTIEYMTSKYIHDPWYNKHYQNVEVQIFHDHLLAVRYTAAKNMDSRDLLNSFVNISPTPRHFYAEDKGKLPENWVQKYNWKPEPVTGPYVIDTWKKGEYVELKRVRPWWGDSLPRYQQGYANVDKIHYKVITAGLAIAKEIFFKEELDMLPADIPQDWREAATHENITAGYIDRWVAKYQPLSGVMGVFFNTRHKLFANKQVRKSMYYAIDIQGMIDNVLFGEYCRQHNVGVGQIQYGIDFNDHSIHKPDFNPDKAKKLLAQAGYNQLDKNGIATNANGEQVTFDLVYSQKFHTERLSYLVEQAKKAGVLIELKLQTGDAAWQSLIGKKFQAYWGGYASRRIPNYWEYIHSEQIEADGANAIFGWSSPRTDELTYANKFSSVSYQQKAKNNKEIERIIDDEALLVPGYYLDYRRVLAWKWVRSPAWGNLRYGQEPAYFMSPYHYLWLDSEIRSQTREAMKDNQSFEPKIWALSERYSN